MSLHLIHPAWVHATVAFLTFGGLIEALGLLAGGDGWRRFGERVYLLGAATLPLALLTGYLAANTLDPGAEATRVLDLHERNGWFLLGAVAIGLFAKAWSRGALPGWQRFGYALYLLVVVGLTVWSGLLGGRMVYVHGLGVGT